jgi:hypothetical protein
MSEQISKDLLMIMNDITNIEATILKIDAAIFVRSSEKIINEKVAYLYNIIQAEASTYGQNQDEFHDKLEEIISLYREKLSLVYDEFYLQYANIQNELQEARLKQNNGMINYQKLINDREKGLSTEANKINIMHENKEKLKENNEIYNKIVRKCLEKFNICKAKFEKIINNEFLIISTLQVSNDINIFQKIKYKLFNIFNGKKRYTDVLDEYIKKVENINVQEIVEQMREETIDFVTELLELGDFENSSLAIFG